MINFTDELQTKFKNWVVSAKKYEYDEFKLDKDGMLLIGAYYVCKLPSIWHLVLIQDWLRDDAGIAIDVYTELCTKTVGGFRFSADMMATFDLDSKGNRSVHLKDFFDTYNEAFINAINEALEVINLRNGRDIETEFETL